ncbi:AraC family transcriptional regulator [Paenibacillus sp. MMS18-CY102]|uniref:AraC family transcriptional regulator n=1 Tax=Paenibacillus sp. MMS18-CY102 TaxID=2682849 RepID=UPI001366551C|nr:AraC family transcriptional regulator [Paenibacillus sp. MMS18-CY102]MWC29384.1 helix-turn-helix domain-containing protein [Paenibacillus sp. MMS18-CY102]
MEWVERMNGAIRYIESHITEEISYAEAAKAACCSSYHFQRMFSFITDVSLAEYIRRRRLTLAAFDLQHSAGVKVVDLALRYGYDSPEAFTRAFVQMHGTTPTAARKAGTVLKAYPPMSFQLSIKGAAEMNYRIEEVAPFSVVGLSEQVSTEEAFRIIPGLWADARDRGVFGTLWDIRREEHPIGGILGVCANGEFGTNESFEYWLAIASDCTELPEGMNKIDLPQATWAVFDAPGPPDGIQDIWKRLYTEWVPVSGYELAYLPTIENYLPIEQNKNELWVPVVKK